MCILQSFCVYFYFVHRERTPIDVFTKIKQNFSCFFRTKETFWETKYLWILNSIYNFFFSFVLFIKLILFHVKFSIHDII